MSTEHEGKRERLVAWARAMEEKMAFLLSAQVQRANPVLYDQPDARNRTLLRLTEDDRRFLKSILVAVED